MPLQKDEELPHNVIAVLTKGERVVYKGGVLLLLLKLSRCKLRVQVGEDHGDAVLCGGLSDRLVERSVGKLLVDLLQGEEERLELENLVHSDLILVALDRVHDGRAKGAVLWHINVFHRHPLLCMRSLNLLGVRD